MEIATEDMLKNLTFAELRRVGARMAAHIVLFCVRYFTYG